MELRHSETFHKPVVFGWVAMGTGLLLLVPLAAMQFTDEVNWNPGDFAVMAFLLFSAGSFFVVVCRRFPTLNKVLIGSISTMLFLYVWAELAVGLFFSA